jgi:hypothetical protein
LASNAKLYSHVSATRTTTTAVESRASSVEFFKNNNMVDNNQKVKEVNSNSKQNKSVHGNTPAHAQPHAQAQHKNSSNNISNISNNTSSSSSWSCSACTFLNQNKSGLGLACRVCGTAKPIRGGLDSLSTKEEKLLFAVVQEEEKSRTYHHKAAAAANSNGNVQAKTEPELSQSTNNVGTVEREADHTVRFPSVIGAVENDDDKGGDETETRQAQHDSTTWACFYCTLSIVGTPPWGARFVVWQNKHRGLVIVMNRYHQPTTRSYSLMKSIRNKTRCPRFYLKRNR